MSAIYMLEIGWRKEDLYETASKTGGNLQTF